MIHIQEGMLIERPAADIFAYLTEVDNFRHWQEGIVSVELVTPGPWQKGTRIKTIHKFLAWKNLEDYSEITAFQAGRLWESRGKIDKTSYWESFSLQDRVNGTFLDYRAEIHPGGIFHWLQPLAAFSFRRQMRRSLQRLGKLLERMAIQV